MARLRPGRLALPLLMLVARPGHALTYTVAPGGDDTNPGTTAQPFKTLQRAADLVQANDTVHVEAGTYAGFSIGLAQPQVGFEDSPITFLAAPGVVINAPNANTPDGIDLEGVNYVVIDGFEVRGAARAGIRAVSSGTNAVGVTITNNDCHDNGMWGIFTSHVDSLLVENNRAASSTQEHGIYVSGACVSPVVRGNVLSGNAQAGLHLDGDVSQGGAGVITGALVEKNVIFDNGLAGGAGIDCDGVQSSRLRNNLIYAEHASGISLYETDAAKPSIDNVVVNNTVVVASDGRWALDVQDASMGNIVLDNILLDDDPMHGSIDISADSLVGFTSDYNILQPPLTADGTTLVTIPAWQGLTGQDEDSRVAAASALFVNEAAGDYHLLPTALAVGDGTTTDAPADDLDGTPRAGQDDIGAYQQCCRSDGGGDAGDAHLGDGSSATVSDGGASESDHPDADAPRDAADAAGATASGASSGCGCATPPRRPDGSAPKLWQTLLLLAGAFIARRRRA